MHQYDIQWSLPIFLCYYRPIFLHYYRQILIILRKYWPLLIFLCYYRQIPIFLSNYRTILMIIQAIWSDTDIRTLLQADESLRQDVINSGRFLINTAAWLQAPRNEVQKQAGHNAPIESRPVDWTILTVKLVRVRWNPRPQSHRKNKYMMS